MKQAKYLFLFSFLVAMASCRSTDTNKATEEKAGVAKAYWGHINEDSVFLYTLTNHHGTQVKISTYGGTVVSFVTADKNGNRSSIVIGLDSLHDYLQQPPYFGALIGRYGNRIAHAQFELNKVKYTLEANDGSNTLHGGFKGFDKVLWTPMVPSDSVPSLHLHYMSRDGEGGYPGNLQVKVTYTLTDDDGLKIEYDATTDKPTPVNLTNHSYFNLTGNVDNSILGHQLWIDADAYTPVDSTLIPTGSIVAVKGTPFDFTVPKKIGRDIDEVKGGYDHNWVLNGKGEAPRKIAVLSDSISGRALEIYTTEPGLQFYSGNFLDGKFRSRAGKPIKFRTGLCLETQHFPDSPNEPSFPSTILNPGETYHSVSIYKVVVQK